MSVEKIREFVKDVVNCLGSPHKFVATVDFQESQDPINLPMYPKGESVGNKSPVDSAHWKRTDGQHMHVVMSKPQHNKAVAFAIIKAREEGLITYPQVTLNYCEGGGEAFQQADLEEDGHRIMAGSLCWHHKKYGMLDEAGEIWLEREDIQAMYSRDKSKRTKAILKYSPLSILLGCYGSHASKSSPPRQTGLCFAQVCGESPTAELETRSGTGNYFPPVAARRGTVLGSDPAEEGVPAEKSDKQAKKSTKKSKDSKDPAAQNGLNTTVINLDGPNIKNAKCLRKVRYKNSLSLSLLCDLCVGGDKETNVDVRIYMVALWMYTVFLVHERGWNFFAGRDLTPQAPPVIKFICYSEEVVFELSFEKARAFYEESVQRLTKKGLLCLERVNLRASDALSQSVEKSVESKTSRNGKEE